MRVPLGIHLCFSSRERLAHLLSYIWFIWYIYMVYMVWYMVVYMVYMVPLLNHVISRVNSYE